MTSPDPTLPTSQDASAPAAPAAPAAPVPAPSLPPEPAMPAAPVPDDNPLSSFGLDLSDLLAAPGSTDASVQSFDVGFGGGSAAEAGFNVDVSIGAPGGIPEVSADIGGYAGAEGQFDAFVDAEVVDIVTDADAGTTDISMHNADGAVSGYGGFEASGGIGIDFTPSIVDGGIPGIGISADADFASASDYDVDGGYDHIDLHNDNDLGGGLLG